MPKSVKFLDENWKKLLDSDPKLKPHKKRKRESSTADSEEADSHKNDKRLTAGKSKPEIWFDDVDKILIENDTKDDQVAATESALVKAHSYEGSTKIIGIDCEMVGVGDDGRDSILARVSIVNRFGKCIYDMYVKSLEPVTDYRTEFSGIRPKDLEQGKDFKTVQKDVSDIIKNRILVGHAVHNDLKVLFLGHPKSKIRDTSKYKPFRRLFNGRTPSLKALSQKVLAVTVQSGEHDSVQDAQAAMRLYTMHRKQWEADIRSRSRRKTQSKSKSAKMKEHVNGVKGKLNESKSS